MPQYLRLRGGAVCEPDVQGYADADMSDEGSEAESDDDLLSPEQLQELMQSMVHQPLAGNDVEGWMEPPSRPRKEDVEAEARDMGLNMEEILNDPNADQYMQDMISNIPLAAQQEALKKKHEEALRWRLQLSDQDLIPKHLSVLTYCCECSRACNGTVILIVAIFPCTARG